MSEINHEVLMQFTSKGLTINEGIAIDARLVQSASHPLSNEKLEEAKVKSLKEKLIRTARRLNSPAILSRTGW